MSFVKYLSVYIIFTLSISAVFLNSCSSDDNANVESSSNEPVLDTILISSDFSSIEAGNTVTFSAVTNLGTDVTDEVVFSVGGTIISGNTYVFQEQGSFVVTAIYNNITSNSIVINVTVLLTSINLSSNSQSYFLGDLVEFSVIGNNGIDLTDQSTISIVGDSDLSSNIYATSEEGMFSFVATYDDFISVVYDINVLPAPTRFNQNVLIEDYTGTWCGYCPRISYAIDLVNQQTSEAVVVAIHRGSSDPYNFPAGVLEDLINLQGYPTAMLNRTTEWNYPEPYNVDQVIDLTSGLADVGLAISSSLDGSQMSIDVKVKFGGQFSHSSAKLVLYVLEDGLFFDQTNYTSYYGGSSTISNFEHNHVLRASLSNLMGDQIPEDEYSEDNVYEVNYTSSVPSNISINENMTLVAFVTNEYNAALNVRVANFEENQVFEEL